jgi:hypothetical protein
LQEHDRTGDAVLLNDAQIADSEMDPQKRLKDALTMYDRIADQEYIAPLTSQPQFFTHSSDLIVGTTSTNDYGFTSSNLRWK